MKFSNEAFIKEIIAQESSETFLEGSLYHRKKSKKKDFKNRWFKLRANLLFYYKMNSSGLASEDDPKGLLVLTSCEIAMEGDFFFSVKIGNEEHQFKGFSQENRSKWVNALQMSNLAFLKTKLSELKKMIALKNPNMKFLEVEAEDINPRLYEKKKNFKGNEKSKRNKSVERKNNSSHKKSLKKKQKGVSIPRVQSSGALEQVRKSYSLSCLMMDSESGTVYSTSPFLGQRVPSDISLEVAYPRFNFDYSQLDGRRKSLCSADEKVFFNGNTYLGAKYKYGKYLTVENSNQQDIFSQKSNPKTPKYKKHSKKKDFKSFCDFPSFIDNTVLFTDTSLSSINKTEVSLDTHQGPPTVFFHCGDRQSRKKLREEFLFSTCHKTPFDNKFSHFDKQALNDAENELSVSNTDFNNSPKSKVVSNLPFNSSSASNESRRKNNYDNNVSNSYSHNNSNSSNSKRQGVLIKGKSPLHNFKQQNTKQETLKHIKKDINKHTKKAQADTQKQKKQETIEKTKQNIQNKLKLYVSHKPIEQLNSTLPSHHYTSAVEAEQNEDLLRQPAASRKLSFDELSQLSQVFRQQQQQQLQTTNAFNNKQFQQSTTPTQLSNIDTPLNSVIADLSNSFNNLSSTRPTANLTDKT